MIDRHQAPPGAVRGEPRQAGFTSDVQLPSDEAERKLGAWGSEYLRLPDSKRIGVCFSGGGIRSASYCLGALQVLEKSEVLSATEYLAAVSGGDYLAVAHTVVVAATYGDFTAPPGPVPDPPPPPSPVAATFEAIPPFAPNSPEERHLRDYSSYLARGVTGKVWLGINVIYGAIRTLLPFLAALFAVAAAFGLAFHRWLGPVLLRKRKELGPVIRWNLWLTVGVIVVALLLLLVRQFIQRGRRPNPTAMLAVQQWVLLFSFGGVAVGLFLVVLPELLQGIARARDAASQLRLTAIAGTGGAGFFIAVGSYLVQRLERKRVVAIFRLLMPVAGILVIGIPFVGFTYWVAQQGLHFRQGGTDAQAWPLYSLVAALVVLAMSSVLTEAAPTMHMFYRERLAKAFVGRRRIDDGSVGFEEPDWSVPLSFSKVLSHDPPKALPKLVICAAVNASDESIPLGRSAGPFTFERDFSGSPLTGYVPTSHLEAAAGEELLTLPALMAISGAALSPAMGRMTRSRLRALMAIFNVRLGVWLPNPTRFGKHSRSASALRKMRPEERESAAQAPPVLGRDVAFRRPGSLYILREALGKNSLEDEHVYVTDGGHWENLGLVELLRRGCGQILCFDAAGGDLEHFHTISEAIAFARSDLGVVITLDLEALRPKDGQSASDYATGTIRYPDGTDGVLVFAKLAMAEDAPLDAKAFREVDRHFPTHSTVDQFFNERKFESYRGIGIHAAEGCITSLNVYRMTRGFSTFLPPSARDTEGGSDTT